MSGFDAEDGFRTQVSPMSAPGYERTFDADGPMSDVHPATDIAANALHFRC